MKRSAYVFLYVLLLSVLNGCNLDNLDFEKLSKNVNMTPEFVAPVAKANITVWDIVQSANNENEDVITKDQNGLVKIVYRQNDLFNYNVRDLLDFPASQNFTSGDKLLGNISPNDISVSRNITLNELAGKMNGALDGLIPLHGQNVPFPPVSVQNLDLKFNYEPISDFNTITLGYGNLVIDLINKLKVPLSIRGSFFDVGYNRLITEFTFTNIAPTGSKNKSVNLSGFQLSNQVEFRLLSFETTGSETPVIVNLADYFSINFTLSELGISKGNLMIMNALTLEGSNDVFEFNFPEPDLKAFGAVLKRGSLSIKTTNNSQLKGSVNLTLNEIKNINTGNPIKVSIPLTGSLTNIPLENTVINFTADPAKPYNRIPYIYTLEINKSTGYINYSSTDVIKMEITLNDLEFQSITGDFGKRTIQIDPGVFDMNVDLLNKIEGNFKLANPTLELIIRNSIGMPASVDLDFTASNKEGKTAKLNPPLFDIPVPANINSGIATGSVFFNKGNSNIVNFIALPPTGEISYMGQANFNPTNMVITPQNPNFLDLGATFAIDMSMELPLEMQINNLTFKDTSAISGSDYDKIESAELILNAKNGIPLDIDMQLIFID
ncbi:MAG: hypothetical protein Q7J86_13215, partial [Bacteroidota bacterium]|nr:hypothetical protein [Bacteroidota bacterium]